MITRIVIPQAFENMEEATIGAWHRGVGDSLEAGDVLCELITEKTTFDLECEGSGVLRAIVAAEKSIVPVGYIIALLGDPVDTIPDVSAENAAVLARKAERPDAEADALQVTLAAPPATAAREAPSAGSRVRATPAARRAARDKGVAIEDVATAFPDKVISEDDVAKFAEG